MQVHESLQAAGATAQLYFIHLTVLTNIQMQYHHTHWHPFCVNFCSNKSFHYRLPHVTDNCSAFPSLPTISSHLANVCTLNKKLIFLSKHTSWISTYTCYCSSNVTLQNQIKCLCMSSSEKYTMGMCLKTIHTTQQYASYKIYTLPTFLPTKDVR